MTKLMQQIILQLSEEEQNILAPYLQKHLVEARHQFWSPRISSLKTPL